MKPNTHSSQNEFGWFDELYFVWLISQVKNPAVSTTDRYELLRLLHNVEYVWVVLGDDNRVGWALELRSIFTESIGREREDLFPEDYGNCSVLELLVSFSLEMTSTSYEKEQFWFWEFLKNLGLFEYTDDILHAKRQEVCEKLDTFIWRTYTPLGVGGLFPLENPPPKIRYPHGYDARTTELWFQVLPYLDEHGLI